ncbi:MAG: SIMPL domain-containing protein [Elusimicrobia bacterium]|nr:SIMPL domain-containing protein [Elusimicrobiota bacterium]
MRSLKWALVLGMLPAVAVHADRYASFSGNGSVEVQPDVATVQETVTEKQAFPATEDTVAAALAAKVQTKVNALKSKINAAQDVVTFVTSQPEKYQERDERGNYHDRGWTATTIITVRLKGSNLHSRLQTLGPRMSNPRFGLSEAAERAAEQEAIVKATQHARGKAEASATASGNRLGKLVASGDHHVEVPVPGPRPAAARAMMSRESAEAPAPLVDTEKAMITVRRVLHFIWELMD